MIKGCDRIFVKGNNPAMTTLLDASNLSLREVHRLLNLERQLNNSFTSLLSLAPITELEQQDLDEICTNFYEYYADEKISEGEVKFLTISPLLWLSGFYNSTIKITLEEKIAEIFVEDEDTLIKGRMDILAATKPQGKTTVTPFWILVIETKNVTINAFEGLPQLLTYAYTSLENQEAVWGLTTNGMNYRFVYLQKGNPSTYQLFPDLNLIDSERAVELLQVLKAICSKASFTD